MNALRALVCAAALVSPAAAVNLVLDYSYDTNNFFGAGNPSGAAAGAQARSALEAAASLLSTALTDTFSPITVPAPFNSAFFDGVATWTWTQTFNNPVNGAIITLQDGSIAANEYRIYAGGGPIGGSTLGIGGPGGWGFATGGNGGGFTQAEINQIDAISDAFAAQVTKREEPAGDFGNWGGSIRFDSDGSTLWHYNHLTPVQAGRSDFYSVALHELVHALGFGASSEWTSLLSGSTFTGPVSRARNGGVNPRVSGDTGHWLEGTQSTVYGGTATQEAAMDPTITTGTRKLLTNLDFAGLDDIGWDVATPIVTLAGDYNGDNTVNAADYTRWRDTLGTPSPIGTYNEWRTNYGASGAATAAAVAVPEPKALAIVAMVLVFSRWRR